MKLALLSFHNAANYGAGLQAYALQRYLEDQGFETEYIDYQNDERRNSYDMLFHIRTSIVNHQWIDAMKYFVGTPFLLLRKRKFSHFYSKLHCTKNTYYKPQQLDELSDCYDKYVVGSDQVWNPNNNGYDTTFLLSFVNSNKKKISYSSSFGITSVPDIIRDEYKKYLGFFSHLSCREMQGCKLIKELTGREATHVLDPVFLLDSEKWDECIRKKNNDSFIFCYTNRKSQLSDFFRTTNYQLNGNKIYKLTRYVKLGDFVSPSIRIKYTMSPEEFLGNIRDSKLVITASFHCIALSIIFNKQFVCFVTGDKGKDERVVGLLQALGLEDRIYTPNMSIEDINKPINYDKVNMKKAELVKHSSNYLLNAINS